MSSTYCRVMIMALACAACDVPSTGAGGPGTGAGTSGPTGTPAPGAEGVTTTLPGLVLAETQAGLSGPTSLAVMHVTQMRDLWVRAQVTSLHERGMVHLQFYTPKGELFLERHFPFAKDLKNTKVMSNAGHEVDVLHPTQLPGGWALDLTLPVGGGPFDRNGVEGTWKAQVVIDRPEGAQTLSQPFEMDLKLYP